MQKELEILRKKKFSKTLIEEKFEISDDALFLQALAQVYKSEPIDNSGKVLELKSAIESGQYRVDESKLLEKILSHLSPSNA